MDALALKTSEIRQAYLDFFVARQHRLVESAPLVPLDDPTLLFTTAGMVPFKRYYDGTVEVPFRRATSCQKCLRVKGKASDLENVGRTPRHHTFFEMLGNFSFGDYFKREAIAWAWEFSTRTMGLDPERIWPTVFESDDEAFAIWRDEIGIDPKRITRMGRKDNFWGPAGETGACGPCSELLYDRGEEFGEADPANNDARFLEFWNLVFPQYDYTAENPERPLKNRGIDTGMGLERLAMLVQGKATIFETDGLLPACEHLAALAGRDYRESQEITYAINACVDHARCLTFAISEGIIPSNEGRGYVMRAIIRRAIRLYKTRLHHTQPVLFELVGDYVGAMGDVYPQIKVGVEHTKDVIRAEEERFLRTVDQGEGHLRDVIGAKDRLSRILRDSIERTDNLLSKRSGVRVHFDVSARQQLQDICVWLEDFGTERPASRARWIRDQFLGAQERILAIEEPADAQILRQLRDHLAESQNLETLISGNELFYLYDTLGYPVELSAELCEEHGLQVDLQGYGRAMAMQRAKARAAWKGAELAESEKVFNPVAEEHGATEFLGYDSLTGQSDILALAFQGKLHRELRAGEEGEVILAATPFYAESGGQVGDTGTLTHGEAVFTVKDTQKTTHGLFRHIGVMTKGTLQVGQVVKAEVDAARRGGIMRHHTATHLLNAALRRHLGAHIKQAGSLNAETHLRFDFTHGSAIDEETRHRIEATANRYIRENHAVVTEVLPIEVARQRGAVAVFGEKYGEIVRVVSMGPDSVEFCGGTHLARTGEVGAFVITGESSIAAGTRRIEALAGDAAVRWLQAMRAREERVARALSIKPDELETRLAGMQDEIRALRRELADLRQRQAAEAVKSDVQTIRVGEHEVIAKRLDVQTPEELRNAADVARQGRTKAVVVLGAVINGTVSLVTATTGDAAPAHAGKLVQQLSAMVGGKGGGRPDMAQGGGKDAAKLDEALAKVPELVKAQVG